MKGDWKSRGFATRAIHAGQHPDPTTGSVTVPIYATSTYVHDELGVHNVEREARTAQNLARLADRVAEGGLVLPVAATFPLDQVAAAFTALEGPHAPGKIVVLP